MNEEHKQSLATKVLSRIEHEGVRPRPRWHFVLTNWMLWSFWGVSVVVGAIAVAATIFSFRSIAWQFYRTTHNTLFEFIVDSLPYLWVVLLVVFIALAYENIRRTKRGYRYPLWAIVGASVFLSFALGIVLYVFGIGQIADLKLGRIAPYFSVSQKAEDRWVHPERGLLAGDVITIAENVSELTLRDFHGTDWNVEIGDLSVKDLEVLETTTRIRLIVVPPANSTDRSVHVCLVFPWDLRGVLEQAQEQTEGDRLRREIVRASLGERNLDEGRNSKCEGVVPYELLQKIKERQK